MPPTRPHPGIHPADVTLGTPFVVQRHRMGGLHVVPLEVVIYVHPKPSVPRLAPAAVHPDRRANGPERRDPFEQILRKVPDAMPELQQRCRCATLTNGFLDPRCFALLRTTSLGMTMMGPPLRGIGWHIPARLDPSAPGWHAHARVGMSWRCRGRSSSHGQALRDRRSPRGRGCVVGRVKVVRRGHEGAWSPYSRAGWWCGRSQRNHRAGRRRAGSRRTRQGCARWRCRPSAR